jgi:sulfite dehydrogenase
MIFGRWEQLSRKWVLLSAALAIGVPSAATPASAPVEGSNTALRFSQGRALFAGGATPACAICHTLREAGSEGAIGPVLDDLKPDAARVARALRNGVGQMPSYKAILSDTQIEALATYVSKASGGE